MNDEKLIQLIQQNPDKGIRKAMQLYGKAVNTICCSFLRECEDGLVDEAVSDTFFKLWKNSHQFKPEEGHCLKSWIYSIARNTAIDICRKKGFPYVSLEDEKQSEPVSSVSVETEIQKRETKRILHEVIAELGEPDSQVFLFKCFLFSFPIFQVFLQSLSSS